MQLSLDPRALSRAAEQLRGAADELRGAAARAQSTALSGSFSAISGLGNLGGHHGGFLRGGDGSARAVLSSLADELAWSADGLGATFAAVTGQDLASAAALERGAASFAVAGFPPRPPRRFASFSFPAPACGGLPGLAELEQRARSSRTGDAAQAADAWRAAATSAAQAATRAARAAGQVRSGSAGSPVEAAAASIDRTAAVLGRVAANCGAVGASLTALPRIVEWLAAAVARARA
ncbi:hypothetical protein, partial [Corynebacterium otitidis]